jgi:hypothetical protein
VSLIIIQAIVWRTFFCESRVGEESQDEKLSAGQASSCILNVPDALQSQMQDMGEATSALRDESIRKQKLYFQNQNYQIFYASHLFLQEVSMSEKYNEADPCVFIAQKWI